MNKLSSIAASRQIMGRVLIAGLALVPARGDVITIKVQSPQPIEVFEGDPGNIDFTIKNTGTETLTLTFIAAKNVFSSTGGLPDVSDNFKLGNVQSGKSTTAPNNTLTAGESFFYRVPFTTPDDPRSPPTENTDFGQWKVSSTMFVGIEDSAGDKAVFPDVTIIVHDKGNPFFTPEPSMLYPIATVCVGLLAYGCQRRKRLKNAIWE